MSGINNKFKTVMLSGVAATLCSCAATQTAIEHGKLATSTKMSDTIFLDPVVIGGIKPRINGAGFTRP